MLQMQLYIQDQRVDVFKDESVTLTDSIQNVRDFEKIFTSFSQSFNLPASKTNNKILKHYYNFSIDEDFAFDARIKTPANIELNSLPFRRGYIKLEGVDLKDNIPYSYRITFFGEIVKLKDAIGESKLSDLEGLGSQTYNSDTMVTYLTRDPASFDVVAPLITHTQRLYWDSGESTHNTGNLAPGGNKHGVKWNELKPAMRVNRIIQAIEDTFPQLEFTNDFFKNTNNPKFNNLFLWLSRKSGAVENLSGNTTEVSTLVEFPVGSSQAFSSGQGIVALKTYYDWQYVQVWRYRFINPTGGAYRVEVYDAASQLVYSSPLTTSSLTIGYDDLDGEFDYGAAFRVFIIATTPVTFEAVRWNGEYDEPEYYDSFQDNFSRALFNYTTALDFQFEYSKQMPDMTVLNFLSGLFRMFNLTAFVQDDGKIKVQPLDEYYEDTPIYRDITEYVGIEKSSVDAALPYRQVKFEFSDTKSFLANKYGEINNKKWGLIQYNNGQNDLTGSLYKVTAPFGHFLFERLTDQNDLTLKNVQWGWSVDKSENALLSQPLLFYPVNPTETVPQISVVTEVNIDNEPVEDTTRIPRSLPMNSYSSVASTGDNFQLNFAHETSEWTGNFDFDKTLFSSYRKYITGVFNPKQRITKVEVMLPLAVLLQIQMKDRIIIAGDHYLINKLTTNLSTGKSQLELLNNFNIEA